MTKRSTRVSKIVKAPRSTIYRALVDPAAVEKWLAPDGMRGEVHEFDARQGGTIRMSLTYQNPDGAQVGKSSNDTDTFQGRFVELVPDVRVVEVATFESDDPAFAGEMTIAFSLDDADGGTEITCLCENIPTGIRLEDNELGTRQSLQKLARLVES